MEIKVKPKRVLFFDDRTGFGIFACNVHNDYRDKVVLNDFGNISMKGNTVKRLEIDKEYIVKLVEDKKSSYKGSYVIEYIRTERPKTPEQQREYLETILTPTQVSNIFEVYDGQDIITLIEKDQFDYSKVKGLGEKTYEKLKEKIMETIDISEVLMFFGKYGIKYSIINKLIKKYKSPLIVIEKIKENPYILTEVKGIGFMTADAIAKAIGYDLTSFERIDACIRHVISEVNSEGHSWISYKDLINRCVKYLAIDKCYIIDRLKSEISGVKVVGDRYTLTKIFIAEKDIARELIRYKNKSKKVFKPEEIDKFLDEYCEKNNIELEENQRKFFHDWNENNILFLIGHGGMGKSFLQKILVEMIYNKGLKCALLAPTGKASKVMSNYTGWDASTIHRRVGMFDKDDPDYIKHEIEEDIIIIDEVSMCDVFVLSRLFNSITNPDARILFVGDDFQLPSVGVGNFLYDAIHSGCIKISRLKKVFRQSDGGILNVATDVREGKKFLNNNADGRILFGKDCLFHLIREYIKDGYLYYYKKLLKKYSPEDIIILSPTKKGELGTYAINRKIQQIVNPPSPDKKEQTFERDNQVTFRVGDSVINTVNTYGAETLDEKAVDIFNGDSGTVIDFLEEEKKGKIEKYILVDFEGNKIKVPFENALSNLLHSWALTIHKSQGSEYKAGIVIVDKSMTYQLNSNLLYTGFSRMKEYMIVLTQAQTVNNGMKKFANMERRSFLKELIMFFDGENDNKEENYCIV